MSIKIDKIIRKIFFTLKMLYIGCSKKGAISLLFCNWTRSAKLKSKNEIQDNLHFENATYSVLLKRHNKAASFSKHLDFLKSFTHEIWVGRDNVKSTGKICDTLYFEKVIYRVLQEESYITSSWKWHLEFPEKWSFTHKNWVSSTKVKPTKNIHDTFHFKNTSIRVFHERRNSRNT